MPAVSIQNIPFARPGGDVACPSSGRPVDLVHLARQTHGDRDLEDEVLRMFSHQAGSIADRLQAATPDERKMLAHTLKGSARGIGAFSLAGAAEAVEAGPSSAKALRNLAEQIGAVQDFICTICR